MALDVPPKEKIFHCHEDGPPGPLRYWNLSCDEKDKGIKDDFELKWMEKVRLIRLRPDCKDKSGWSPTTRVEFIHVVAREALRDGRCE